MSILSFCSSEAAAQCIEYGDFMHQSGSLALPALAYAAATDGSVALVANSFSGLQVVDVTDPSHPILAATLDTPGEAVDVAIRGEFGFVADGQTGLLIVDLTDPYAPVVVATVDTPGVARAVCLEGDWAYVADMEAGVQVVDISDPHLASLAASFCPGSYVLDIAVGGHKAYIAANSDGLLVVDVRDPLHAQFEGAVDGIWHVQTVATGGNYVYAASGFSADIDIVEIGALSSPRLVQTMYLPDDCVDVTAVDSRLYVASSEAGLLVYDVSELDAIQLVGGVDTPGYAYGTAVAGGLAVVADFDRGLHVIDVSTARTPVALGEALVGAMPYDICVQCDFAYPASRSGLHVVDIGDPAAMGVVGVLAGDNQPFWSVAATESHAFVTQGSAGLRVIDIGNAAGPEYVGALDLPGDSASAIALAGNLALVTDTYTGLHLVNISDPRQPVAVSSLAMPDLSMGVSVRGNLAFVAAYAAGLQVVDFSDVTRPIVVGSLAMTGETYQVEVRGDLAYVVGTGPGLQIVDVSDPSEPRAMGQCQSVLGRLALDPALPYAYVMHRHGFKVVDIRDAAQPQLIGEMFRNGEVAGMAACAGGVLFGDWDTGLVMAPVQCGAASAVDAPVGLPTTRPLRIAPNPLSAQATIAFDLERPGTVEAAVYDLAGRLVRHLAQRSAAAGPQQLWWDGRNDAGRAMPAGVYLVTVRAGGTTSSARLALVH
ncbi:MAG: T9SS type A sorting domain-containing protein [bacterium]|nr:T9SS type A sorting domain-containing protein [bacterium]